MLILFTDFGHASPYVGQMKLAIHRRVPGLPVIDLLHEAPAFDSRAAAYLLAAFTDDLPAGCAVVGVIDPGVGSDRDGLILQADGCWYVGPDNGLFERVAARAGELRTWRISWRPQRLSASFHGRDLFAPVAAMLAAGLQTPDALGEPLDFRSRGWPEDELRIIYIDPYGNAMTGVRIASVVPTMRLRVAGVTLHYARTFAEVPVGQGFWYGNSSALAEIAVNQGSAAAKYGLKPGAPVTFAP